MPSEEHEALVALLKTRRENAPEEPPSIEEIRTGFEEMTAVFPLGDDVACEPVKAGAVPAEWVRTADSRADRAILYLHGGAYVVGSILSHRELASRIARESRAACLVLDYRLAPEHRFPAAVEDATAAYRWLLASGLDAQRLVVAGDSAGGGLTLATLFALRDAGDPLPAAAVCLSPWADLECTGDSARPGAIDDPILQLDSLVEMGRMYAEGAEARAPLASPLYGDYAGLPPLLIQVGTREILVDDARRVAERAKAAGVDVALETEEGLIHDWHLLAATSPEAQRSVARIGEFVTKHTA